MKKIIPEAELTEEQQNSVSELARELSLCETTVRILYGRGIDTADKIKAFLHPGKDRFLNPFLMSGMKEAVKLITLARDEDWSVLIYGDYDADGVCATTILCRALADFGVRAEVYVPERKNGYGLSIAAIDELFEEYCPQLFITVDCGISNAEEVEYIKEQGAEVIVTDHHELPEKLPDCICVNPKFADDYPYDNLCGAGVAFKVGCALNGKSAYAYLDFAAIATVADSVPLTGENRDIVTEGLNLINNSPRKNYSDFNNKPNEKITAQSIAFSVVPKINAAGRMGDANAALRLFLSSDEREIYDYSVKLSAYNLERQKCCEELYDSAKAKLKEKGANGRVIVLSDDSWNTGFVGIVAARIAEEYCRPTLLFVNNGDMLKGSARSVDGVNIFEALKACSDVIAEFGGHSQAAGVNLSAGNLPELEKRLDEYLHENYSAQAFTPTYYINGEYTAPLSAKLVKELELLEPFGVGNRRPQFVIEAAACKTRPLVAGKSHLAVKCDGIDLIYFSGLKYERIINSTMPKRLIFEYNISTFKGREQIKGYLRDVVYQPESCAFATESINMNALSLAALPETECKKIAVTADKARKMFDARTEYGTAFVVSDPATLKKYKCADCEVNIFTLSAGSLADVVILSPQPDCDLSEYENIVFLDDPKRITLPSLKGKTVYVCTETDGTAALKTLDTDREALASVFRQVSAAGFGLGGSSAEAVASEYSFGVPKVQALFALKVFEELGIISFSDGRVTVRRGIKTSLNSSALYNFICSLKEKI